MRGAAAGVRSWLAPQANKPNAALLYVSIFSAGEVNIYPLGGRNQKLVGQITGLTTPEGMAVDRNGNLYVTEPEADEVAIFPKGASQPASFLQASGYGAPVAVAVGNDDTAYVVSFAQHYYQHDEMLVYPPGSEYPSRVLTLSSGGSGFYSAIPDAHGNLFATVLDPSPGYSQVVEFPANSSTPIFLPIYTIGHTNGGRALDILLDSKHNVVISDFDAPSVDVFTSTLAGNRVPSRTFAKTGNPSALAFDSKYQRIFVVNQSAAVAEYDYATGNLVNTITDQLYGLSPSGLATLPAPKPPAR